MIDVFECPGQLPQCEAKVHLHRDLPLDVHHRLGCDRLGLANRGPAGCFCLGGRAHRCGVRLSLQLGVDRPCFRFQPVEFPAGGRAGPLLLEFGLGGQSFGLGIVDDLAPAVGRLLADQLLLST